MEKQTDFAKLSIHDVHVGDTCLVQSSGHPDFGTKAMRKMCDGKTAQVIATHEEHGSVDIRITSGAWTWEVFRNLPPDVLAFKREPSRSHL